MGITILIQNIEGIRVTKKLGHADQQVVIERIKFLNIIGQQPNIVVNMLDPPPRDPPPSGKFRIALRLSRRVEY
ncbi:MAG: hypothetical protein MI924_04020 [Chloroflexales bacterium]|nr:hypothetical protein [Chloroflexales bacterium]